MRISDYDGRPGARADALCGQTILRSDDDDRYARYSNRGADVDLLAPGTCVISTLPSADGDATQRLTGTSMAAPHVSAAAARYLAANPGTEPGADAASCCAQPAGSTGRSGRDPNWDGPSDTTAPRRLLDVEALLGPPGLRAWVMPQELAVGADTSRRRARVDIQRLGGYDGRCRAQARPAAGRCRHRLVRAGHAGLRRPRRAAHARARGRCVRGPTDAPRRRGWRAADRRAPDSRCGSTGADPSSAGCASRSAVRAPRSIADGRHRSGSPGRSRMRSAASGGRRCGSGSAAGRGGKSPRARA